MTFIFCCICLNFFKIHLNVVSMERSRSNSRSNTENSEKGKPVQECFCRAVLFQGFVVTSILDAFHNSLLLKCIIVKTQGRFLWR